MVTIGNLPRVAQKLPNCVFVLVFFYIFPKKSAKILFKVIFIEKFLSFLWKLLRCCFYHLQLSAIRSRSRRRNAILKVHTPTKSLSFCLLILSRTFSKLALAWIIFFNSIFFIAFNIFCNCNGLESHKKYLLLRSTR